jgi:hypothetical protein
MLFEQPGVDPSLSRTKPLGSLSGQGTGYPRACAVERHCKTNDLGTRTKIGDPGGALVASRGSTHAQTQTATVRATEARR